MIVVNIEVVKRLLQDLAEIDKVPFDQIEWHLDGKPLDIPKEILKEWKFMGMCNHSFVDMEFYNEEPGDSKFYLE